MWCSFWWRRFLACPLLISGITTRTNVRRSGLHFARAWRRIVPIFPVRSDPKIHSIWTYTVNSPGSCSAITVGRWVNTLETLCTTRRETSGTFSHHEGCSCARLVSALTLALQLVRGLWTYLRERTKTTKTIHKWRLFSLGSGNPRLSGWRAMVGVLCRPHQCFISLIETLISDDSNSPVCGIAGDFHCFYFHFVLAFLYIWRKVISVSVIMSLSCSPSKRLFIAYFDCMHNSNVGLAKCFSGIADAALGYTTTKKG